MGESHDDDDPDTQSDRQSSDAQSGVGLWEVAYADVAPGLAFALDKILSAKVQQVLAILWKNRGELCLLANVNVSF